MADDFHAQMAKPPSMTEEEQVRAGKAIAGAMGDEHMNFVKTITGMLDRGEIDVTKPETFLKKDVYDKLDADWKAKTDLAMVNIGSLLNHIADFYTSKQTPDASPQLESMIEQLWRMKERIEVHADVFKF